MERRSLVYGVFLCLIICVIYQPMKVSSQSDPCTKSYWDVFRLDPDVDPRGKDYEDLGAGENWNPFGRFYDPNDPLHPDLYPDESETSLSKDGVLMLKKESSGRTNLVEIRGAGSYGELTMSNAWLGAFQPTQTPGPSTPTTPLPTDSDTYNVYWRMFKNISEHGVNAVRLFAIPWGNDYLQPNPDHRAFVPFKFIQGKKRLRYYDDKIGGESEKIFPTIVFEVNCC